MPDLPLNDQRPLSDRVLDLVVFAPVGILRRLRDDLPALIASGRREVQDRVRVAHWVGEMAVAYGRSEMQRRLHSSLSSSSTTSEIDTTDSEAPTLPPFEGYDELPADRLVQLLSKFPAAELAIIRLYEQKQRSRRTVLAKIDQLIDA